MCCVCVRFIVVAANDLFIYILIVYGCEKMRGRKRWRGNIFWNRLVMITESGGPMFMSNLWALLGPWEYCKTERERKRDMG